MLKPEIISSSSPSCLGRVLEAFQASEPVALPTETVYGLAAPLDDENAILKIFEYKKRPQFNPLIVHVLGKEELSHLTTKELTPVLQKLLDAFWPGPLSFLLPKKNNISDLVTSGSPFAVFRSPQNEVMRSVLAKSGKALVAPSANIYQSVSPTSAEAVFEEFSVEQKLQLVVDGGESSLGLESTIVSFSEDENELLVHRLGAIGVDELLSFVGDECSVKLQGSKKGLPGSEQKHYSPGLEMEILEKLPADFVLKEAEAFLSVFPEEGVLGKNVYVLSSEDRNFKQAAKNLYKVLRELKNKSESLKKVYLNLAPEESLGVAINDRLRRAAF